MSAGRIRITEDAGVHVLALTGEHDVSTTVPTLSADLARLLAAAARVVVDLTETEFIDSSVVGTLIAAHMQAQAGAGGVAIAVAPGTFADRLLSLVGVSEIGPVFPTRAAAVAAVSAG